MRPGHFLTKNLPSLKSLFLAYVLTSTIVLCFKILKTLFGPQVDTMNGKWASMTAPQDMTIPVLTGVAEDQLIKVGLASINPQGKVTLFLITSLYV